MTVVTDTVPVDTVAAPTVPAWIRTLARPAVQAWLRLEVRHADRVPATGPVVLAPHHRSHADVLAVGAASRRPVTFLGSEHLTRVPLLGRFLPRLGMVPVHRGHGDADAMDRCLEVLDAGAALVVFPEGTRSRDGRVYRPRSGVARLSAVAGAPVVPVGVVGTEDLWPIGGVPRPFGGVARVVFGRPIAPPADAPGDRRRFAGELHDALVDLSGAPRADGLSARRPA